MNHDQIALQLYTIRDLAAADLPGTLGAVAEAGYRFVEVAGMPEASAGSLSTLLSDAGLGAIAIHAGIEALRADPDAVADRLAALGTTRLIVPWMPAEDRRSADDVRRFADELTRFAALLAPRGVHLGYHNHAFEFEELGGGTIWDVLLDGLGPDVELEIDVYWATVGGRDPVTLIGEVADRVRLLHMKDLVADPDPRDGPAGQGSLDFPSIVAAGRGAGVEWYIAEQDHPRSPLDDVAAAYSYLESIAR
ncbi:MAG TPA: sugar phosphate isomerase/epimerase [Candidatus Limnocylindrales bacterium]